MERALEGHDLKIWHPRKLSFEGGEFFLLAEGSVAPGLALILHEHELNGVLVGAGAAHHGEHLVHSGRLENAHEGGLHQLDVGV